MRNLWPDKQEKIKQIEADKKEKQLYDDLVQRINDLAADFTALDVHVDDVVAQLANTITTSLLTATNLNADDIRAIRAEVTNIATDTINAKSITDENLTVSVLATISRAVIESLSATNISAGSISADNATFTNLSLDNVNVPNLNAAVLNAVTSYLDTANISTAFIDDARISAEHVADSTIDNAVITDETVTNSDIANLSIANKIDTNNITHEINNQLVDDPQSQLFIELPQFHNGTYRIISKDNQGNMLWSATVHNEIAYLDVVYDTSSRTYLQAIAYAGDRFVLIGKTDDKTQNLYWINDSLERENPPTIYTQYDTTGLTVKALKDMKGRFILTVSSEGGGGETGDGWQYFTAVDTIDDLNLSTTDINGVVTVVQEGLTNSNFVEGAGIKTPAYANVSKEEITTYNPVTGEYEYDYKWHLISGERQFDTAAVNTNGYVMTDISDKSKLQTVGSAELDNGSIIVDATQTIRNKAVLNAQTLISWDGSFEYDSEIVRNITQLGTVTNGVWNAGNVTAPKVEATNQITNKPRFYSGPVLPAQGSHITPIDDACIDMGVHTRVDQYYNVYPDSKRTDFTPPTGATETSTTLPYLNLPEDERELVSPDGLVYYYGGNRNYNTLGLPIELYTGFRRVEKITPNGIIFGEWENLIGAFNYGTEVIGRPTYKHWVREATDIEGLSDYDNGALLVEEDE